MPVIATWSPADAALDILVPLGLVAGVPSGLVIDLDPNGPNLGGEWTLADLVRQGPSRSHLEPPRRARAFLTNGGVPAEDAAPVVSALVDRWPATVLRCAPRLPRPEGSIAFVPLLPEPFTAGFPGETVYQRTAFSPRTAPVGVTLPPPRRRTVACLLAGQSPPKDRWIRALGALWGTT